MAGILLGKSLIVTGAGGGIGRAACLVLSAAGAKVLVTDINEEAGKGTVEAVSANGGTAAS
jgi:NAD(P)-dependent dehydrogenase (short-subunit alcohol dehydrogenase family)